MRKINILPVIFMAGVTGGSACAMERPVAQSPQCTVSGADKLHAEAGGAEAICSAIRAAAREKAPGTGFRIEVRVISASSLSARITLADGRLLPEQKMAVSDRQLNPGSIQRFAAAIAVAVAEAAVH